MYKIVCYVHEEVEGALDKILEKNSKKSLANYLWDQNLEVVNIKVSEENGNEWEDEPESDKEPERGEREERDPNELVAFHDATGGTKQ